MKWTFLALATISIALASLVATAQTINPKLGWIYPVDLEADIDGFEVSQCEFDLDTGSCSEWRVVNTTLIPASEREFTVVGIPAEGRSFGFIVQAVKIHEGNKVRSDPSNLVQRVPASGTPTTVEVVIKVDGPTTLTIQE